MPLCFGRFGMYRGPPKCVNILETLHKLEIFGNSTAEFQLNKGKSSSPTLFVPVVHQFEQMFCRAPLPQVGRAVVYDVRPACVYLTKVLQTKTH